MMMTSSCRTCRASIVWAVTVNGKAMPIDAEPTENGNVKLTDRGGNMAPLAEVLGPLDRQLAGDEPLRMPHHATCTAWPAKSKSTTKG